MGKGFALVLVLFFLTSLVVVSPVRVEAQSKTIVIPDDYPTITAAVGNATNGDTILVRVGTYEGPINSTIVINKSISIIGESTQNTVIKLYPAYNVGWILNQPQYSYTDAITITADSCSLQGLTLQIATGGDITAKANKILIADAKIMTGWATGVKIQGSNCRVTNNVMDGRILVTGNYNQIDDNSGCFVAVGVSLASGQFGGSYNFVKDNTCQGLGLAYSSNNVFFGNNIVGNSWEPSGIDVTWSANNLIYENKITGQIHGDGLRLFQSSNNTVKSNDITRFTVAGVSISASNNNLFTLNNFYGKSPYAYYVSNDNASTDNIWSDGGLGNFWGDYQTKYPNATEVDSSGFGNTPYIISNNNTDPYPLMSNYDISTAQITLPDWTNLSLPNMLPTPTFPPFIPNPTLTSTPTFTSSSSPSPTVPEFPSWTISLMLSMVVVAGLLVYFKKRRKLG